jgi:hypothetical protein
VERRRQYGAPQYLPAGLCAFSGQDAAAPDFSASIQGVQILNDDGVDVFRHGANRRIFALKD